MNPRSAKCRLLSLRCGADPIATRTSRVVCMALALAACNSSYDDGGGIQPTQYDVVIDPSALETTASIVDLFGVATCDACPPSEAMFGMCPPVLGPFESAIGIQWFNHTTGDSGGATHGIYGVQSWLFSYCTVSYSHRFSAHVPLAFGPNEIELMAIGPSANPGTDTITLTRTPAAPAVRAASAHGGLVVSWDPVVGADSYELLWSTVPDLSFPETRVIAGVTSPFFDVRVSDDETRYYAVRAIASGIEGPLSEVVFATAGWISETLPAPAMSWQSADTSIAVDPSGFAHIHMSRLGTSATGLIANDYFTNAGGAWSSIHVANVGDLNADIALGADESAHVTYLVSNTSGEYAQLVSGSWNVETFASNASCTTSLELDPIGGVHILYYQHQFSPAQVGLVRYATNTTGPWVSQLVDTTTFGCFQEGSNLSLALDALRSAHALYRGAAPRLGLRYATNATGAWASESVATGYVRCLAMALDVGGTAHVVWTDDENTLIYAKRSAQGAWQAERVDTFTFAPAIAVETNGDVHVCYVQYAQEQLRYAKHTAGLWQLQPIGTARDADTAIALDAQGRVHISYFDAGDAKYITNR